MAVDGKDWKLTGNFSSRIRKKGEETRESNRERHETFVQKSTQAKGVAKALLHKAGEVQTEETKQTTQQAQIAQRSSSAQKKPEVVSSESLFVPENGEGKSAEQQFTKAASAASNLQKLSTKQQPKINAEPKSAMAATKQVTEKNAPVFEARNTVKTPIHQGVPEVLPKSSRIQRESGKSKTLNPETQQHQEEKLRNTFKTDGIRVTPEGSRDKRETGTPQAAGPVTENRFESISRAKTKNKKDEVNKRNIANSTLSLTRSRKESLGELEAGVSSRFGGNETTEIGVEETADVSSTLLEELPQTFKAYNAEAHELEVVTKGRQYKHFVEKAHDRLNAIREFDEELEMGLKSLAKRVMTDDPDLKLSTADFIKSVYGGTRA